MPTTSEKPPVEEVFQASRQLLYVLLSYNPQEEVCAGRCAETLQEQYEHIIALDHQRVKLADLAECQQLTPKALAAFAGQMKDSIGLLQQLCGTCRTRINQHWLQVEFFDAAALVRFNRPLHLPAHVTQALAQRVAEGEFQKTPGAG